jgi:thiol peroxidase
MADITYKGSKTQTNGSIPQVGSKAPNFTLTDNDLNDVTLNQYLGKKTILSINPSLDTSVCSIVLKKFNEEAKLHADLFVAFISADLPFAQKRLCIQQDLKNAKTLSTFRSPDFAKNYGLQIISGPLKGLLARACIAIDEKGKILYTELVPEIGHEPNYKKALEAVL